MSFTTHRALQYFGIILIGLFFAGAYYYFQARAGVTQKTTNTTQLNTSQNSLMTNGLVGLWTFDGADISGTTAYDRSANTNNGTLTNGPVVTLGRLGQAVDFDGSNDYVSVADNATLDFDDTADLSISGWFYRDNFESDDTIIAKSNGQLGTDTGYLVYIDDATDKLVLKVGDGTDLYTVTSTSTFTATGWNHFTVVWDQDSADNTEIYIDGAADGGTDSGTIGNIGDLSSALVLAIGAESDAGSPFIGSLDEIRVYNRAFVASEAQSLYELGRPDSLNSSISALQGTGRLDSGLGGYWALDENTGTSATDSSTNGNTGTLTNSPTWTTGQINYAVDFDGTDDYISIGDVLDTTDSRDFAISGWFNRDTATTDDTIIAKSNGQLGTDTGYLVYIDDATDKLVLKVGDGTDLYTVTSTSTFTATGWNHFVAVWDDDSAGGVEIYINGHIDNATDSGTIEDIGDFSNAVNLYLGAESDVGNPFDGKLDEMRVYNRTLSSGEVANLYRLSTPTGTDTGLQGYWSFNGGDIGVSRTVFTDDFTGTAGDDLNTRSGWTKGGSGTGIYEIGADGGTLAGVAGNTTTVWWQTDDPGTGSQYASMVVRGLGNTSTFLAVNMTPSTNTGYGIRLSGTTPRLYRNFAGTFTVATTAFTLGDRVRIKSTRAGDSMVITMDKKVGDAGAWVSMGGTMTDSSSPNFNGVPGLRGPSTLSVDPFADDWQSGSDVIPTALDRSGTDNNGLLKNGATKAIGKLGQGLDFDGTDDYVSIPDHVSLDATDTADLTITGWFYRDTATTDDTIIAKRDGILSTDTGYIAYIDDADDKLYFEVSDGTDEYQLAGATTFAATGWHHFAIVWDQDSAANSEIYIDGADDNATDSGTIGNIGDLSNALVLAIGTESDAVNPNPFDGKLDEMRVYNRTLSVEEIYALYNQGR